MTKPRPPYEVVMGVRISGPEEARQKLKQHGFESEFIHVGPDGGPIPSSRKYDPGVVSFEVYRHRDGRCMAITTEFAPKTRGRKQRLDDILRFSLNEVELRKEFA